MHRAHRHLCPRHSAPPFFPVISPFRRTANRAPRPRASIRSTLYVHLSIHGGQLYYTVIRFALSRSLTLSRMLMPLRASDAAKRALYVRMRGFYRHAHTVSRTLGEVGALGSQDCDSCSEEPIIEKMYGGMHLSTRQGEPKWVPGGLGDGRLSDGRHGM
jgi:hypothetical protein